MSAGALVYFFTIGGMIGFASGILLGAAVAIHVMEKLNAKRR